MIDLTETPLPQLPPRAAAAHKGDFGRALIVGGSLGMAGAPALAGMACLRSGAGLVSVATPRCVQSVVAGFHPAYMTHGLADDGERLAEAADPAMTALLDEATATAVGPGVGRSDAVTKLVVDAYLQSRQPMVIDADGLNALAEPREQLAPPQGPRVLTPHTGEFARLSGRPLDDPSDDNERRDRAADLARTLGEGVIVLLKGACTVITDGERYAVNATGNPGMATGGSGDVLTGVITALLAQGIEAMDAARLGAHAHGLAGDLAAAKLGEVAMTATDLVDALPDAWRQLA